MLLHTLLLCLTFQFSLVAAQFGFFEQMFGGHHQQQQQRAASGANQWAAQSEAIACAQYLCPATLACVSNPSECPCPDVQDVKCLVPDSQDKDGATVVCVRGTEDCAALQRFTAPI